MKSIHKKIIKTLLYNPTFQELADIKGHTRQSITPIMNEIPKEDKAKMHLKRLAKIKQIMEE